MVIIMDVILVGMFTLVAVSGLYMTVISLPCCGCFAPSDKGVRVTEEVEEEFEKEVDDKM
jgi:hypothetical protein